jgi:hypothetical protein
MSSSRGDPTSRLSHVRACQSPVTQIGLIFFRLSAMARASDRLSDDERVALKDALTRCQDLRDPAAVNGITPPGTPARSKATSAASKRSNGKGTAAPNSTCSAAASSSPRDDQPHRITESGREPKSTDVDISFETNEDHPDRKALSHSPATPPEPHS